MKKPNFFIVGAAKAGTTSLYYYLDQHPDVYMSPIKEPHFFCKDIRCRDFNDNYRKGACFDVDYYLSKPMLEKRHIAFIESEAEYLQLFRDVKDERLVGEISNGYLYSKVAAKEIYEFNKHAKIVMVLRDPVERAFSHWTMDLRGNEVCRTSFVEAVKHDQAIEEKGWGKSHLYVELGLYYEQVKRYFDIFPKHQILLLLYDSLKQNPPLFFRKLFAFLETKPISIDAGKRHNVASVPRNPWINSAIKKLTLNKVAARFLSRETRQSIKKVFFRSCNLPVLTADDKSQMSIHFFDDIKKLEELIGKDLSCWQGK